MNNCLICNSSSTCTNCTSQFVYQNGSCQDTGLSNCVYYSDDFSICLICQPGYYNDEGSCSQCSGCDLCSTGFICLSGCQSGYTTFNYNCIELFWGRI